MAKKSDTKLGAWAFLVGVVLAVIFAFFSLTTWVIWLLFVIGVLVGLLNITDKEAMPFLISGTALVIVSALGRQMFPSTTVAADWILGFLTNLLTMFVPATIIVALRAVFGMAKD